MRTETRSSDWWLKSMGAALFSLMLMAIPLHEGSASMQQPKEFKPRPASARSAQDVDPDARTPSPPGRTGARGEARPADLLEMISNRAGGKAKVDMIRSGKPGRVRPASGPTAESEMEEAAPGRRVGQTSMEELLEIVSRRPGGKEKVEAARAHGRRPRPDSESNPLMEWLAALNPFRAQVAHGQIMHHRHCLAYPDNGWTANYCKANAYGGTNPSKGSVLSLRTYTKSSGWGSWGHRVSNPVVVIGLNVTQSNYYLINVSGYGSASAELRHREGTSYPVIESFTSAGSQNPTVEYLAQGYHWFYWVQKSGYYSVGRIDIYTVTYYD